MSGLERLKFKCECHHADGIIRMTRDQLRGIIEQIEQEANHPVQAGSSYRITFYDRLVLGWVEAHGGLDEIKKGQEIAEGYKECLNGVCRRLGPTDGSGMPEMPEVIYSEIGRAAQDSENRRAELCSSLGIDLETGWGDAMVEMRSRFRWGT